MFGLQEDVEAVRLTVFVFLPLRSYTTRTQTLASVKQEDKETPERATKTTQQRHTSYNTTTESLQNNNITTERSGVLIQSIWTPEGSRFRDSSDEERLSLNSAIGTEMRRRGRGVSMATHGPQPGGGEEDESERRDSSVYVLVGSELR